MQANNPSNSHRKLREAMDRLFDGKARLTDGKLTKTNLAREAGVSPATMYRAKSLLVEWDQQVSDSTPRNAQVSRLEGELTKTRKRVRNLEQQNANLRRQITAAATVIAELTARMSQSEVSNIVPLSPVRTQKMP